MFDFGSAQQVKRVHVRRRGQNYDFRYSEATKRFYVSDAIWEELELESHGFNVQRDNSGNIAFEVVADSESTYLKARISKKSGEQMGKGKGFTGSVLRPLLDKAGLSGVNKFSLTLVEGSPEATPWYEVSAMELDATDDADDDTEDDVELGGEEDSDEATADEDGFEVEDATDEDSDSTDEDSEEENPFAA